MVALRNAAGTYYSPDWFKLSGVEVPTASTSGSKLACLLLVHCWDAGSQLHGGSKVVV